MSLRSVIANSGVWVLVGLVVGLAVVRLPVGVSGVHAQGDQTQVNGFVFTAHGDHGQFDKPETLQGFRAVAQSGAVFSLGLGDLSYEGIGDEQRWCQTVQRILGPSYPFEIVMGNHEDADMVNGSITNFARHCPDRMNATGIYGAEYYFDYPATSPLMRVIMVGAGNDWDWNGDGTLDPAEYFDYNSSSSVRLAHLTWLADAIDSARRDGVKWIVVGMHKNCLSAGEKSCEIGQEMMNLLLDKKVDLILQGHDHTYQRTKQLALGPECSAITVGGFNGQCVADSGADGVYTSGAGTIVVITGHFGGRSLYKVSADDDEAGYFAKVMGENGWYDFLQSDQSHPDVSRGFIKFTVTERQIVAEHVATTNPDTTFSDVFSIVDQDVTVPPAVTQAPTATVPEPPAETSSSTHTLKPVADTYVQAEKPDANFGTNIALRTDASPDIRSYLRFDTADVNGLITRATLRIYANSASSAGFAVHDVSDNSWSESDLIYSNAPALGQVIVSSAAIGAESWAAVDVTDLVTDGGQVSFGLTTTGNTAVNYSSREGAHPPELIIEYDPAPPVSTLSPPADLSTRTFAPVSDAYVQAARPDTNYGTSTGLRIDASPEIHSFVRFEVRGVNGTIARVILRIYAISTSSQGIDVLGVLPIDWTESDLTYNNAPVIGTVLDTSGAIEAGMWTEVDVSAHVTGDGPVTFALATAGSTAIRFSSKEGIHAPELVVEFSPAPATPTLTATVTRTPSATPTASATLAYTATSSRTPSPLPTTTRALTLTPTPSPALTLTPGIPSTSTVPPAATSTATSTATAIVTSIVAPTVTPITALITSPFQAKASVTPTATPLP